MKLPIGRNWRVLVRSQKSTSRRAARSWARFVRPRATRPVSVIVVGCRHRAPEVPIARKEADWQSPLTARKSRLEARNDRLGLGSALRENVNISTGNGTDDASAPRSSMPYAMPMTGRREFASLSRPGRRAVTFTGGCKPRPLPIGLLASRPEFAAGSRLLINTFRAAAGPGRARVVLGGGDDLRRHL